MEKNTETQLAQTQRSFKSDKILQNKSKIQTSLIGTKKKNSTKITPTINEKHHNPKNLDYELLENKEKNVDQNQNSLTIVKNNLDNTSHSTNQNPQTPENNYDRFKCSQNEQIDEKSLIISKTDKSLPIGPILKQKTNLNKKKENYKKASKQNISIVKKSNNRNFSACESQDFEKKPSNDFDSRPYEISPIHINNNNDIMDFKKYETKFEECTGDIEFSKRELEEYQKMITSKTFIVFFFEYTFHSYFLFF